MQGKPALQATKLPATVLVVDDEPSLRDAIAYALRREGFVVETAAEGSRAIAIARERSPDLIVLDIMLPGIDGLQVCRVLRSESPVPILMLSAKGEEMDRIVGLEIGADDYLPKPFHMRELIARVNAQLRRVQLEGARGIEGSQSPALLAIGDVELDITGHRVLVRGRDVAFKPREFDLLAHLMTHMDKVVTRQQLLRQVWGYDIPIETRTIDVHVRWIRQKLTEAGVRSPEIETVRGVGYRLTTRVSADDADTGPR